MRLATEHHPRPSTATLRAATYNIHKGVRGVGLRRRLEIHNLEQGVASLKADVVLLQEVRLFHHRDARRFSVGPQAWPSQGQAEFLAPQGWHTAYRPNAITLHGEHGNALLSRWPLGAVGQHVGSYHPFETRVLPPVPIDLRGRGGGADGAEDRVGGRAGDGEGADGREIWAGEIIRSAHAVTAGAKAA